MPTIVTTPHHSSCRRASGPLIVPALVITEVACLIGSRLGVDAEIR